jgi:hypothetical protein
MRELRDATRDVAQDLDNLKIMTPERFPEIATLSFELQQLLARGHKRVAKDARWLSKQAKASSARHIQELIHMKKTAQEAVATVNAKERNRPNPMKKPSR